MKRSARELTSYKNKCDICGWKGNYSYIKHCKSVQHIKAAQKFLVKEERDSKKEMLSSEQEDDEQQYYSSKDEKLDKIVDDVPLNHQNENPDDR